MYIPTTFFGAQAAYIIASGSKSTGLNYYTGLYFSGSQPWEYHYWGGDNNDAESTTTTSGSLVIFSGSTQEANVYVIGGGGGSGNVHIIYPNGIGGGGAGGVVRYNKFSLFPGTYEIVAGGGGDLRPLGNPPGPFTPGTAPYATAGFPGYNSYIKLPYSGTYTPFTSSYILAFGGSGGGAASGDGVNQGFVTASNSIPGGSNGGNAQTFSIFGANTPTSSLGIGLGGLNGLNQGNLGGGVGADNVPSHLAGCSAGGGGAMSRSLDITPIANSPYYSAATTNGGDGIQLKIYPLDNGTASYYAGGGNATNCITRTSSSYGLGGGKNKVGSGGGNSCTPVGQNFNVSRDIGNAGGVYIEYPLYPPLSPSTMIYDGLTLWNSYNSVSGGYWADLSGNNNTGKIYGSNLSSGSNMINFNGIDNYIQYGTLTATPSSSMTLIWYGVYNTASLMDLFTKDDYVDGWDTIFGPTKIVFRDNLGGDADLNNVYQNGKTVYTLTVTNGTQKLYRDYLEIASSNKGFNGFTSSPWPLKFGWNANSDASYFSGSISDVLIYNRVLTKDEIISVSNYLTYNPFRPSYSTPVPLPAALTVSTDGLVLWNTSGSFSGSIWYDRSGNNNNAFVSGSTMVSNTNGWVFNGTNNYLSYTPNQLNNTPTNRFTLQWYGSYPDNATQRDLFCKENSSSGWDTNINISGSNRSVTFRDQNNRTYPFSLSPNTKQLLTLTIFNDTYPSFNTTGSLYLGDTLISTLSGSYLEGFNKVATPLKFGFNADATATYLTGSISDIVIYNKVLTQNEIAYNLFALSSSYS